MVNPEETTSAPQSSGDAPQAQAQLAQQHISHKQAAQYYTLVIDRDPTNTANRWNNWKKDIERQFCFFGIYDTELKTTTRNSSESWTNTFSQRKTKITRDSNLVICNKKKTNRSPNTSLGYEKSPRNANITMKTTSSETI